MMDATQSPLENPPNPTPERKGPVVVLTGASSGIGADLAVELASRWEARLGLLARRAEKLDAVADRVRAAGGDAVVLPCDVVDDEAIRGAVAQVENRLGPVDLAIANAGISDPMSMRQMGDFALIQRVLRINLEGAANLFAAVLPGMLERGRGHIAAVSSIAGFRGLPGAAPYCASKAGLSCYMESLRLDLRHRGITVTTIHPGFVKTAMTDKNPFPMPFLLSSAQAAVVLEKGLRKKKRDINFPWQMVLGMRLVRWMPDWLYDRVLDGRPRRGMPSVRGPSEPVSLTADSGENVAQDNDGQLS